MEEALDNNKKAEQDEVGRGKKEKRKAGVVLVLLTDPLKPA